MEQSDFLDYLEKCLGVLVIDDIGSEKITEKIIDRLFVLIDKRCDNLRRMSFTSNYDLQQLKNRWGAGDRLINRIRGCCDQVKLFGENKRF